MKKVILVLLTVIFIFSVSSVLLYFIKNPFSIPSVKITDIPLPDYLAMTKNNQISTLNFWTPAREIKGNNIKAPDIPAKSVLIYELNTNQVIYSKNSEEKTPMASLTKIMTAIIALEHPKQDNNYIVHKSSLVGEDSMDLVEGETLTLEDLLYGLVLRSANDAAEVLADNYQGGRVEFIEAMNNKAKALGLKDTNFTNPSGLQGDGDQYTTAYDLLVITRYALTNFEMFRNVSSTFEYTVPETSYHRAHYMQNETNLLTSYPGVKGVKTGYTPEAGLCLVTYLERGNHKIIGILLGSNNRREEMKELLDYSLLVLGDTPPLHR